MEERIILDYYRTNEKTMYIIPIPSIDYNAIAKEVDNTVYIKQTPFDIIKENVLIGGADFNGRRRSITYNLGMQKKLPMPINPPRNIYAFPSHAPTQFHCLWIFAEHINHIQSVPNNKKFRSTIQFKNGEKLFLEVSPYILETQLIKTWKVKKYMEDRHSSKQR